MRIRARRGLTLASATLVLAVGCRGDDTPPSAATEGEVSSSGMALDASDTTGDPEPGVCTPGETQACYEGPPGTEGLGTCAAGQQVCAADGLGFGACEGQVWPESMERCDTPQDDDCDGSTVCQPALEWSQTIAGYVMHVAARADGGAVVVGGDAYDAFQGEDLAGMFVIELDADGGLVWARSVGFREYAWPAALAVDPTGASVVVGWYDGAPDLGGGPLPSPFGFGGYAVRYDARGAHVWSYAQPTDGYFAAAFGPDDTTYVVGGYVYGSKEPEGASAQLHVVGLDADGGVSWTLLGQGSWLDDPLSLLVTEAGELALVVVAGGQGVTLGELPISVEDAYEPLVVRIGLDGTPLGYTRLLETPPFTSYDAQAFVRPGGVLVSTTISQLDDGTQTTGALLVALDEALQPVSQRFLGNSTWVRSLAPYPDGTTLMAVDFSGLLELGPIGVGVNGPAVAVVDDEGDGRWAEVLYAAQSNTDVSSVAAAPDGAVLVAGLVGEGGGVLAGGAVNGSFVAKLRP